MKEFYFGKFFGVLRFYLYLLGILLYLLVVFDEAGGILDLLYLIRCNFVFLGILVILNDKGVCCEVYDLDLYFNIIFYDKGVVFECICRLVNGSCV